MSKSQTEEIIALLGFIAGFLAYSLGFILIAKIFFVKAIFDTGCAVYVGWLEVKRKRSITPITDPGKAARDKLTDPK